MSLYIGTRTHHAVQLCKEIPGTSTYISDSMHNVLRVHTNTKRQTDAFISTTTTVVLFLFLNTQLCSLRVAVLVSTSNRIVRTAVRS